MSERSTKLRVLAGEEEREEENEGEEREEEEKKKKYARIKRLKQRQKDKKTNKKEKSKKKKKKAKERKSDRIGRRNYLQRSHHLINYDVVCSQMTRDGLIDEQTDRGTEGRTRSLAYSHHSAAPTFKSFLGPKNIMWISYKLYHFRLKHTKIINAWWQSFKFVYKKCLKAVSGKHRNRTNSLSQTAKPVG